MNSQDLVNHYLSLGDYLIRDVVALVAATTSDFEHYKLHAIIVRDGVKHEFNSNELHGVPFPDWSKNGLLWALDLLSFNGCFGEVKTLREGLGDVGDLDMVLHEANQRLMLENNLQTVTVQ